MSLVLAGLVLAGTSGALFVGRWIAKRREHAKSRGSEAEKVDEDADEMGAELQGDVRTRGDDADVSSSDEAGGPAARERKGGHAPRGQAPQLQGFVCQLGDVVMRTTGEEAWLAGGVVLSEDVDVAVLFVAPDAGHDGLVYVRARPQKSLLWLEPLDPSAILVGGEPPSSVEHRAIRFDRLRRLPLRPRRIGVGAPDLGDAVVVAEYASAGAERLLVLKGNSGLVRTYRGVELAEGSYEVIPSGQSSLEP